MRASYLIRGVSRSTFSCLGGITFVGPLGTRSGRSNVLCSVCRGISFVSDRSTTTYCLGPKGGRVSELGHGDLVFPFKDGTDRGRTMERTFRGRVDIVRKPPNAKGARAVLGVVTGTIGGEGAILIMSGGGSTVIGMEGGLRGCKLKFVMTPLKDQRGGRTFVGSRAKVPSGVRR